MTLFWILVLLVVPAAVFRAGMAAVDRVRPRRTARRRRLRLPEPALRLPGLRPRAEAKHSMSSTLPWFTPDNDPGTAGRLSAPHDDSPTSPATPTRKGPP